ncbi:sterol desaturase family protein [Candidatus Binatia bacterium]|nr:sterol desaturase family protein [Candidatus Binatia bacterium]
MESSTLVLLAIPFFVVSMLLEVWAGRHGWRVLYTRRDTQASLTMGVGNVLINAAIGGMVLWSFEAVHRVALFDFGFGWTAFVACFFAEDLAYYWFHRVSHERRWFWASHVVHHSSQRYNLSTALRQTWTGKATLGFVFWLPLVWIGFAPSMVLFFMATSLLYQFWIHTEAIDRLPAPLELVLNTPSHHRVHHGANPRYLDANYAGVLIVWDRLFRTFTPELAVEPVRYGLVKNIDTYNPLRIAFHEWLAIVEDVRQARSWHERWMYLFGPPGWSPDGSRQTSSMIQERWRAEQAQRCAGAERPVAA